MIDCRKTKTLCTGGFAACGSGDLPFACEV